MDLLRYNSILAQRASVTTTTTTKTIRITIIRIYLVPDTVLFLTNLWWKITISTFQMMKLRHREKNWLAHSSIARARIQIWATSFLNYGEIYVTYNLLLFTFLSLFPFLNVQFHGINYIHIVMQLSPPSIFRAFLSSPTKTLYSLNTNSPFW